MNQAPRFPTFLAILLSLCVLAGSVVAQEDIFNLDALDAVNEVPSEVATSDESNDTSAAESPPPPVVDSLAIQVLRESNPTKPDELLRAAKLANDLGRPDLADEYFTQLSGLSLDDESLARLHQGQNGQFWFNLSTSKTLSDDSINTVTRIIRSADRFSRSADRIEQLLQQLTSDSRSDFRSALIQLRRARESAVNPLVQAIANPDLRQHHARMQAALINLGKSAVPLLHASLAHSNDDVRAAIAEVLGHIKSSESIPYLLGPAFSDNQQDVRKMARRAVVRIQGRSITANEAASLLRQLVDRYSGGFYRAATDEDGLFPFWTWDAERQAAVPFRMSREDAATIVAARLATDLYSIEPTDENQLLAVGSRLALDKRLGGLDAPMRRDPGGAFQLAANAGAPLVEEVLATALQQNQTDIALGAAEVLGEIGSPSLLNSPGESPRPLARALEHESARVRFAAAAAIVALDPRNSYRGSSQFVDVLSHLASSNGRSKVLVGHPNPSRAQAIAGLFSQLGMEIELAHNGGSFRKKSINSSDYEFFLISDRIDRPIASRLLHQLRGDPRTAEIPIGVMTIDENLERARLNIRDATRAIGVAVPFEIEAASDLANRLTSLNARYAVPPERRSIHADRVLGWLAHFGEQASDYSFYNLAAQQDRLLAALNSPRRSALASSALASIGTPDAQYALWKTARQRALPTDSRQAAADAFAKSIRRYHVMLTESQLADRQTGINDSINREVTKALNQVLSQP